MKAVKQYSTDNDYPLARTLNSVLLSIIAVVRMAEQMDLPEDYKIDDLNRAYVLLADELENLYSQNPKLANIKPGPLWRRFDVLKTASWQILDYLDDPSNDGGQVHLTRLDRLCIIADRETPELSSEQMRLVENISKAVMEYRQILDETSLEINAKIENSWYIREFRLVYKPDGAILINDVFRLKKTHIDSAIDKLLEQAIKNHGVLFTPELGRTARNFSTILSSAGFTPTLRKLFFPVISKNKGIMFRPVVTATQASSENIDTTALDLVLRALDADITFSE